MQTVYLHIGTSKTGSTAIQKFISMNMDLLSKSFYFPSTICDNDTIYAYKLVRALQKSTRKNWNYFGNVDNISVIEDQLMNEIKNFSKGKDIFISCEGFSYINSEAIKRLINYFRNFRIKVICYLRRQDSFFESIVNELIKFGNKKSRTKNIQQIKKEQIKSKQMHTYDIVKDWVDNVGIENVILKVYERSILKNESIIDDLFEILGIEIDDSYEIPRKINSRIVDRDALEFKVFINRNLNVEYDILCKFSVLRNYSNNKPIDTYRIFSPDEANEILEKCKVNNEKIARKFLKRDDGILFSSETKEREYLPYSGLSKESYNDIMTYLRENYKDLYVLIKEKGVSYE